MCMDTQISALKELIAEGLEGGAVKKKGDNNHK